VLAATRRGQGHRADDYYSLADGELVYLGLACDNDVACGCGRAFVGCDSLQAGTTATVVEWPGGLDDYAAAISVALVRGGYLTAGDPDGSVAAAARELVDLVSAFPLGAVLERCRDVVQQRRCP
jgi:hypothetical protein